MPPPLSNNLHSFDNGTWGLLVTASLHKHGPPALKKLYEVKYVRLVQSLCSCYAHRLGHSCCDMIPNFSRVSVAVICYIAVAQGLRFLGSTTLGQDPATVNRLNGESFQQDAITTFNGQPMRWKPLCVGIDV
jgi:hypothetical protein